MDEARCDVTYGFLLLALRNIQVPENLANRAPSDQICHSKLLSSNLLDNVMLSMYSLFNTHSTNSAIIQQF